MITSDREFLKCHQRLEDLIETVRQSEKDGRRVDEVERELGERGVGTTVVAVEETRRSK